MEQPNAPSSRSTTLKMKTVGYTETLTNFRASIQFFFFYIHGSTHRNSILIRSNKMQHYAGIYLLQNHSTCFRCPLHPSSGVRKTVTAASGTGHSICATTFLQCGLIRPSWRKVVAQIRDMTCTRNCSYSFMYS